MHVLLDQKTIYVILDLNAHKENPLQKNINRIPLIAKAQDFRCYYCSLKLRWPEQKHLIQPTTITQEHLVTKGTRGSNTDNNIVAACSRCNGMRNDLDMEIFRQVLDRLFTLTFIQQNWHSTNEETVGFIKQLFRHEVDTTLAPKDKEAAFRLIERDRKYGTGLNSKIPFLESSSTLKRHA